MAAYDDFTKTLKNTDVVKGIMKDLVFEAAQTLRDVSKKFDDTGDATGDHHLPVSPFFGEVIIKALLETGQIEEVVSEGSGSLHQFKPTKKGSTLNKKITKENIFVRK